MAILAAAALPEASSPESVLEDKLRQRGFSIDKARQLAAERGLPFGLVAEDLIVAHDAGRSEVALPDLGARGDVVSQAMGVIERQAVHEEQWARVQFAGRFKPIRDSEAPLAESRPGARETPAPRVRDRDAQKACRRRRADRRARRGW